MKCPLANDPTSPLPHCLHRQGERAPQHPLGTPLPRHVKEGMERPVAVSQRLLTEHLSRARHGRKWLLPSDPYSALGTSSSNKAFALCPEGSGMCCLVAAKD